MESIEFVRHLRHAQTDCENRLWSRLRDRRLFGIKFRRQEPLGAYVVDFVSYEKRLIVELDGGQHMENANYDAKRDAWLCAQGFDVARYWNNDVTSNLDGVLEDIARRAGVWPAQSPSPQPLSRQGRGALVPLPPGGTSPEGAGRNEVAVPSGARDEPKAHRGAGGEG